LNPLLARRVVLPLIYGLRREDVSAAVRSLDQSLGDTPEALHRLQDKKLRRLVAFHRSANPAYASYLKDAGVHGTDPVGLDALQGLPVMGKPELVRMRPRSRTAIAKLARPTYIRVTGGSSGAPAVVHVDAMASAMSLAAREICQGWYGIHRGDRQLRLWGRPLESARSTARFKDLLLNRIRVDSLALSDPSTASLVERVDGFGPAYVYGYASMIDLLAGALQRLGYSHSPLKSLRVVVSTSETLREGQRRRFEDYFGCPVADEYGCSEVDIISFQCRSGGRHIVAPNILLESVRFGDEPEGFGQVVVTDLNNMAMPVVRYRLGDLLPLDFRQCSCGMPWPCHGDVLGRSQGQYIQLPSGKMLHSQFVVYAIEELFAQGMRVERFQIVQKQSGGLDVVVAPAPGCEFDVARLAQALRKQVEPVLEAGLPLHVRLGSLEEFENARSNKFQHFRSEVSS
jgi:phenylacetate-CoA ligase